MCNFTKGPWIGKENGKWFSGDDSWDIENYDCNSYSWVEVGREGGTVAIIPSKGWNDKKMEASAHLISAAPEMYDEIERDINELIKLLQGLEQYSNDYLFYSSELERKQQVLAKARGEHV